MAFRGIDVRESGDRLIFRAMIQDSSGAILATGSPVLRLYELQSDATLKSYDFNDNTFKATALTTETLALTHRTGNNATTNTGIWTASLTTLSGFTAGNIYFSHVSHSGATPVVQAREFQFASGVLASPIDGSISASTLASDAITAAKIATGAIDADALASDAVAEIWAHVPTLKTDIATTESEMMAQLHALACKPQTQINRRQS